MTGSPAGYVRHDGSMDSDERWQSVTRFQGGTRVEDGAVVEKIEPDPVCEVFVSTIETGGLGLTLTAASTEVFYSNTFDLSMRIQAEDRLHRIGQSAEHVTIVDLVAEGTVDERVIEALRAKIDVAAVVMRDGPSKWIE